MNTTGDRLVQIGALLFLIGCPGGGGGQPSRTVGGNISGLTGTVVLQNNGGDDLTLTANGTFTFATALATGATYQVAIRTQPATQGCVVVNGSGTVASANVTNVTVTCATSGSLDPLFATGGKTLIPGGEVAAVALQPDGKIVLLIRGPGTNGNSVTLTRLNADGTTDTTFGTAGSAMGDLGGGHLVDELPNALVLQPDGKLVVAGQGSGMVNGTLSDEFGLTRFDSHGALDTSFGVSGKVLTDFGNGRSSNLWSLTRQSDGKLVAVGTTPGPSNNYNFALARYSADGVLDPAFGSGGKVVTDFSQNSQDDAAKSVAVQSDGKLVVAGWTQPGSSSIVMALARYTAAGALDTTFGMGGEVMNLDLTGDNADLVNVALQADGKIVVSSNVNSGSGDFALTRYDSSGALDVAFGSSGLVTTDFGSEDRSLAMQLQSDGKIIVAGFASPNSSEAFGLARYKLDGTLDSGFGTNGKVIVDFGMVLESCHALAIQTDGKIVAAGGATDLSTHYAAVARLTP